MSSLGTLIPGGLDVFFMQQGIKFTDVWFFAGAVIRYYTHTKTQHSRGIRLTHPYNNIFTSPAMCSEQLCLLQ